MKQVVFAFPTYSQKTQTTISAQFGPSGIERGQMMFTNRVFASTCESTVTRKFETIAYSRECESSIYGTGGRFTSAPWEGLYFEVDDRSEKS
jgi:hypothetical protein